MYWSDNSFGLFADARAASPWGGSPSRRQPVSGPKPAVVRRMNALIDDPRG